MILSCLALATALAERAAAEILAIRERGFRIERKADDSVVTEADKAAETIILNGLRDGASGLHVVAEEEAAAGVVDRRQRRSSGWSTRWTARGSSPAAATISP